MADLMTGKSTFSELHQKYGNFLTPAIAIAVDDKDIVSKLQLAVDEVSVDLTLEEAASCSFTVVNAYDGKNRQFRSNATDLLIPGAVVKVSLGYASNLTVVFVGYISEVSVSFQESPTISVTAMDLRRLMMDGGETFIVHPEKSYSDAFLAVMKRYDKLILQKEVDATPTEFEQISQRNNDYDFVTKHLAKRGNREFFVLAGKVYFREPQKVSGAIVTLEWGHSLLSFTRNSLYQDITVKVVGYDEENKEPLLGEANVKSKDKQKQAIPEAQSTLKPAPSLTDLKAASAAAKKEAESRQQRAQGGRGSCIGLPEIVPGRYIKLTKLDSALDKTYYISKVQHSFGSDGFTTQFEIRGWK